MQQIVFDRRYEFVPPYRGTGWVRALRAYLPRHLRRRFGITGVELHGVERLRKSVEAGHGVMVTPNHVRDCDPLVIGMMSPVGGKYFHIMASWHVFMQGRLLGCLARRGGAFSIYREGMDRAAMNAAMEILETAERPLMIFPEGVAMRTNDQLYALMEGTALMARSAAKKRAKLTPPGKVVVHPVFIRYVFDGDIEKTLCPVLDEIEHRLSWRPQRELSLVQRVQKVGLALLCLKEVEYMGRPQDGSIDERLGRLIDHLLNPLEDEWNKGQHDGTVVSRVKRLRSAILPEMVKGEIDEAERQRRWGQLADGYLAQLLAHYPPDYVGENPTKERLLETVERFEEDLTDRARVHGPMRAIVRVGEAIEVSPNRERGEEDPLMKGIEEQLERMMGEE